ncbi:MAG: PDZ domain-containing protein [Pirellulaceae bacterium]|jgi:serine protease Do|nr:PDZ domain-containing protein [Pirellulaceae bacterium]MDP7016631.1 PDZ domain-containing protein [Pirellulaceae bacterium]
MSTKFRSKLTCCLMLLLAAAAPSFVCADDKDGGSIVEGAKRLATVFRRPGRYERMHVRVREAFRGVVEKSAHGTVQVHSNGRPVALGAVVAADGLVMTKFSELGTRIECEFRGGKKSPAEVVGVDQSFDVALLKVDRQDLEPLKWIESNDAGVLGSWIVTPNLETIPVSVGVLSAAPRPIKPMRAMLGVILGPSRRGPMITHIFPKGSAAKSGMLVRDIVTQVNGVEMESVEQMVEKIRSYRPGEAVTLQLIRDGADMELKLRLTKETDVIEPLQRIEFQKNLGGELSLRRDDFPKVLEHDSVLRPLDCGGPLVNLEGIGVGLNIARSSRVSSYAIPASEVIRLLGELRTGVGRQHYDRVLELTTQVVDAQKTTAKAKKGLTVAREALQAARKSLSAAEAARKGDPENEDLERAEDEARQKLLQAKMQETEAKSQVATDEKAVENLKAELMVAKRG